MTTAAATIAPPGGASDTATPAPSTAPPGSPHALNWDSLDEDSQIVEQMRAEHAAGTLGKEPAPAAGQATPAKAGEPDAAPKAGKRGKDGKFAAAATKPESSSGNALPASASAAPDASAHAGVSFETPQAAVDAITAAFEAQDLDKLAQLTGKPRAFFEAGDAKWAAFRSEKAEHRRAVNEHRGNVAALETTRGKIEEQRAAAAAEYGPAIRAAKAYRSGDYEAFATLVKELSGDDYDVAQANVIQGALSTDPATKRMRKQLAEQANEIKELKGKTATREAGEQQTAEQTQRAAYQQTIQMLETDLGNHEAKTLKNYQRDVLQLVRDSWNGQTFTTSFVDAADQLVAERDEENAARGFAKGAPQLPAGKPSAKQTPARTGAVLPPRGASASGGAVAPKWATEDVDDDEIIAGLKADHRAGRLS